MGFGLHGLIVEWALASSLILTCIVAVVTLARFFGGRSRTELEVAKVTIARLEATLVEKDVAAAAKDEAHHKAIVALEEQMRGMSERLSRMDEERKEFAGPRVLEVLAAYEHTRSAQHDELLQVIRSGLADLGRCLGKEER